MSEVRELLEKSGYLLDISQFNLYGMRKSSLLRA